MGFSLVCKCIKKNSHVEKKILFQPCFALKKLRFLLELTVFCSAPLKLLFIPLHIASVASPTSRPSCMRTAWIIDIADTGNIMVPKTTWFERKVRSSLVIHGLC